MYRYIALIFSVILVLLAGGYMADETKTDRHLSKMDTGDCIWRLWDCVGRFSQSDGGGGQTIQVDGESSGRARAGHRHAGLVQHSFRLGSQADVRLGLSLGCPAGDIV